VSNGAGRAGNKLPGRGSCWQPELGVRLVGVVRDVLERVPGLKAGVREFREFLSPPWHHEFSLGLYSGPSFQELKPHPEAGAPLLSLSDVDDHAAALVADPFVYRRGEVWYLFFEVLPKGSDRGVIAYATSGDGLLWRYGGTVLAEPFHLSYPHVFDHGGQTYMLPEAHEAGGVRLYRAERFPDRWVFDRVLVEGGPYVDPTIFRADDRWWLFADGSPELTCDHLHLFHARELEGPWKPHPGNPLKSGDKRYSRPAGPVVEVGSRLYRFAQDCDPLYGLRVFAFEILELSPEAYRERPVSGGAVLEGTGIPGSWNSGGMHHIHPLQMDDGTWIAFVDGWQKRRPGRLAWLRQRLRGRDRGG